MSIHAPLASPESPPFPAVGSQTATRKYLIGALLLLFFLAGVLVIGVGFPRAVVRAPLPLTMVVIFTNAQGEIYAVFQTRPEALVTIDPVMCQHGARFTHDPTLRPARMTVTADHFGDVTYIMNPGIACPGEIRVAVRVTAVAAGQTAHVVFYVDLPAASATP